MSDESEYGEYPGGYTTDYPPHWVRPLLEQYPTLEILQCGYRQGSWAELAFESETGGTSSVTFRREVSNSITIKGSARGQIQTTVTADNVKERDVKIGQQLNARLGGYDSFEKALETGL